MVSKEAELLFNKFVKQVDDIFKKLPMSLKWKSFYIHDIPLLMDICEEVREDFGVKSLTLPLRSITPLFIAF